MRHNIALYLRVSTDEQAQVIEGSLDSQGHRLRGFVDIKNLQEPGWGKIVDKYIDEGLSAKDTRRPAFQRMMRDVRAGKINLILVTDLSRLSRSIFDFCILLEDLKKFSAKFLSLKEQFDTSTPAGEMMVFNMINLAQFERKQTSERVSMNFHARAIRGLRNGGSTLLGYDRDPNDPSRYVMNEAEACDVRRIFELYGQEGSLSRTVTALNAEGIKLKARKSKVTYISSNKWNTSVLKNLLKNISYIGLREVNTKNKNKIQDSLRAHERYQIVKASWEPIVDKDRFDNVQNILSNNFSRERTRRSNGVLKFYLLTGIIYCEDCGRPLVGSSAKGRTDTFRYYVHAPISTHTVTCPVKSLPAEKLEQKVLNHLDEMLFREGYLDSIEDRMAAVYDRRSGDVTTLLKQREGALNNIERELDSTLRLMTKMIDQGLDNLLTETLKKLNREKISLESEIENLKSKFEAPKNHKADRKALEVNAADLKKAKLKATPSMLKRLIQKVISGIAISDGKAKLAYWGATDANSEDTLEIKTSASGTPPEALASKTRSKTIVRRKLELVETFQDIPPLRGIENETSAGSYVEKNGWGARIRT